MAPEDHSPYSAPVDLLKTVVASGAALDLSEQQPDEAAIGAQAGPNASGSPPPRWRRQPSEFRQPRRVSRGLCHPTPCSPTDALCMFGKKATQQLESPLTDLIAPAFFTTR